MSQSQASEQQPLSNVQSFKFTRNPYIGKGAFSRIYKATAKNDIVGAKKGNDYALKVFIEGYNQKEEIEREIAMWNAVNTLDDIERDCFVKFYGGIKSDKDEDVLIFELCKEDMFNRMYGGKRSELLDEEEAKKAIRTVAKALQGLERKGIVHRDIKIDNILRTSTGDYKLADLGDAVNYMDTCMDDCMQEEEQHVYECLQRRCYASSNGPPEGFTGNFLTTKADMWALGVATTMMITGFYPLGRQFEAKISSFLQTSAQNLSIPCDAALAWMKGFKKFKVRDHEILNRLSDDASDFVSKLLKYDPEERMSASEALEHPWLKEKSSVSAPGAASASVPYKRKRAGGSSCDVM